MRRNCCAGFFVTGLLVLAPVAHSDSGSAARSRALETAHQVITPAKLKLHLSFIACDELEGRDTPSRGLDLAARYLASHLEYFGYTPLGDNGSFFQKIALSRRKLSPESVLVIVHGEKTLRLQFGQDFVGAGADVQAPLVFAGFGLRSPKAKYDDYAGLDVRKKVVIVLDGFPDGIDPDQFKTERKFRNRTMKAGPNKYGLAKELGAAGVLVLARPAYSQRQGQKPSPFERAVAYRQRERLVYDFRWNQSQGRELNARLTDAAAQRLGQLLGLDFNHLRAQLSKGKKPADVPVKATLQARFKSQVLERLSTQNVVAVLEGADPKLKDEYVAFSAHYDHIGVRRPRSGQSSNPDQDRICNGADDDGSGTVGILALAEAFAAAPRPRRSLLFIWHAAEEKGLVGSDYLVQHPPVPLQQVTALLNVDMIGRNFEDKPENANHVFLVGAAKTSSDLRDLIFKLCGDRLRLDEQDKRNYFRRSDQYNYAKHNIPVAFFCTGEHKDYHKPSDEVQYIDFDKMTRILQLVFETGLELANGDHRPQFNGQL